jgi:chromosome segregation ATPase
MSRRYSPIILAIGLAVLPLGGARAADSDTETRLREALRNAIAQQRSLEDERATLLAKQSESDKQIEALKAQIDELAKGQAKKNENAPEITELRSRVTMQGEQLEQLNQTLEKWKAAYNEAATVARAKEAERAKLATDVDGLTQRATGCEEKNAQLFKIGNEILGRLEKVSFGDVIGQREPFIGYKRVELQNLVQDERDKLLDQKATP